MGIATAGVDLGLPCARGGRGGSEQAQRVSPDLGGTVEVASSVSFVCGRGRAHRGEKGSAAEASKRSARSV
jgi:hypothetical protein